MRTLNEKLELITENTVRLLKEYALPADAAGIATAKSRISDIIDRVYRDSIAQQVCDMQPSYGPSGIVFYTKREDNKLKTLSKTFEIDDSVKSIATVSKEWWQDYAAVSGKDSAEYVIGTLFQDIKEEMDKMFITKMKEIAPVVKTVTYTATSDMYSGFMSLVSNIMNAGAMIAEETQRGHRSYVICSPKVGAALSSLGFMTGLPIGYDEDNFNTKFLGQLGNIKVFVDSDAASDYIIVGHKGGYAGDSTFILSPYAMETIVSEESSVDNNGVMVLNRFKFVRNPLDNTGVLDSKFAKRINVDFTNMANF